MQLALAMSALTVSAAHPLNVELMALFSTWYTGISMLNARSLHVRFMNVQNSWYSPLSIGIYSTMLYRLNKYQFRIELKLCTVYRWCVSNHMQPQICASTLSSEIIIIIFYDCCPQWLLRYAGLPNVNIFGRCMQMYWLHMWSHLNYLQRFRRVFYAPHAWQRTTKSIFRD